MRPDGSKSIRYLVVAAGLAVVLSVLHGRRVLAAHDAHEMGGHMTMTELRPVQPGDAARADAIVAAARKAADAYTDYRKALADGYTIFHPEIKQEVYHFTNNANALATVVHFDPAQPTSLLYERTTAKSGAEAAKAGGEAGYKLVGVMYTAPYRASEDELDRRVPLSVAQWHLHTNLCMPRGSDKAGLLGPDPKFGLQGSITTQPACEAAGGFFIPHLFGWMVHVYPYESDPRKIWAAGMEDHHGMQHDRMPAGMNMPM